LGNVHLFDYTACVRPLLRYFLLLTMMLAVPLQGLASASMLGCAFAGHPGSAHATADPHDMAMSDCHENGAQPESPANDHNCKHCAACFAGSLPLPPEFAVAATAAPTQAAIPHLATHYLGPIPEDPERPPRTSLS
jgi:hypothetical protein